MEEQLNMMRRGRQFKQLMNKKMDGIIREYDVKRVEIEILRFLAMSGERNTAADIHRYLDLNKGRFQRPWNICVPCIIWRACQIRRTGVICIIYCQRRQKSW